MRKHHRIESDLNEGEHKDGFMHFIAKFVGGSQLENKTKSKSGRERSRSSEKIIPAPINLCRMNTVESFSSEASGNCTLDEYSNSIFLEDDDPTIRSEMSDFAEDSDPKTPSQPKTESREASPEAVTYNPLFNNRKMHELIESKKQPWVVPEIDTGTVTHENPLFQNYVLHQRLLAESIRWEVPAEITKQKRRFFKRQSLTDILSLKEKVKSPTINRTEK